MSHDVMEGVPTAAEAKQLLEEAQKLNPGAWVDHSMHTGKAAEAIAGSCSGMDTDTALVLGMLHDIGRRYGVFYMRHIIDGYHFAMEKGYGLLAKICLTHSFCVPDIRCAFGKWDCTGEEYAFVKTYLETVEYNDYDRLIQLCDALALPGGYCLMEKRMVDVALRHGMHEHILPKWKETFLIKQHFEEKMGKSIYSVLPGVVENTFGMNAL